MRKKCFDPKATLMCDSGLSSSSLTITLLANVAEALVFYLTLEFAAIYEYGVHMTRETLLPDLRNTGIFTLFA